MDNGQHLRNRGLSVFFPSNTVLIPTIPVLTQNLFVTRSLANSPHFSSPAKMRLIIASVFIALIASAVATGPFGAPKPPARAYGYSSGPGDADVTITVS